MGVSIALIKKLNGIGNDDYLFPGRKLRLVEKEEVIPSETQPSENELLKIPKDPLIDGPFGRKRSKSNVEELNVLDENIKKPTLTKWGSIDETHIEENISTEGLKSKLRSTLATGGNISNIDKIFEHVLNESK